MNTENFKIQLTATQALHNKYGFCPAPQQVTLLESDGEGTYILFRVGEHEYRCENGEITNIEDQKKSEEAINFYFDMYGKASKDKDIAEEKIGCLKRTVANMRQQNEKDLKRKNELRFEIHRMKDQIRKLEPAAAALIGMIKED